MSNFAAGGPVGDPHRVPVGETPSEHPDGTPFIPPIVAANLADGRYATIIPLTYGRARICRQESPDSGFYDDSW